METQQPKDSSQAKIEKPIAVNAKAQKMVLILGGIFLAALILSLFFGGNTVHPPVPKNEKASVLASQYDKANGFSDEIAFEAQQKRSTQQLAQIRARYHHDEDDPQDWKQKEAERVLASRTTGFGLDKPQTGLHPAVNTNHTATMNAVPLAASDPRLSHLVLTANEVKRLQHYYHPNSGDNLVGHEVNDHYADAANKKGLLIPTGTVIRGALDQELNSDYTGAWRGIIIQDVYSIDNQFILLPKGTKVVGQSLHVGNVNEPIQNRMGLTIDWIVLPNGKRINCKKQLIQDRAGVSAVGDSVNRHLLWQLTGVAAYALVSASLPNDSYNYYGTVNPTFKGQLGDGVRGQLEPLINKYLSLVPTVRLRVGTPIQIFIQDDVYIPAWTRVNTTVYQGVNG